MVSANPMVDPRRLVSDFLAEHTGNSMACSKSDRLVTNMNMEMVNKNEFNKCIESRGK